MSLVLCVWLPPLSLCLANSNCLDIYRFPSPSPQFRDTVTPGLDFPSQCRGLETLSSRKLSQSQHSPDVFSLCPLTVLCLMSENNCFIYFIWCCNSFMRECKPGSFYSILSQSKSLPSAHIYFITMVTIWNEEHLRACLFYTERCFYYIDFT